MLRMLSQTCNREVFCPYRRLQNPQKTLERAILRHLKGVGGQQGARLGFTSVHFDLVHLICPDKDTRFFLNLLLGMY